MYPDTAPLVLFRSPTHPYHWVVWSDRLGWQIFPAKVNGWAERASYTRFDPKRLQPVPLWMGFNTGLLEAVITKAA
jgi:hypothetical protein